MPQVMETAFRQAGLGQEMLMRPLDVSEGVGRAVGSREDKSVIAARPPRIVGLKDDPDLLRQWKPGMLDIVFGRTR
jgi:hypothetical protein